MAKSKKTDDKPIKSGQHQDRIKRLFFDIEVSYYEGWFWRPGRQIDVGGFQVTREASIICICWKWEGRNTVYKLTWDKNQCDKDMIKKFAKHIHDADEVIGHNGDNFDIKWLRTRCAKHKVSLSPYIVSIDTLKVARKFKFPDNKLDTIAKYFGEERKSDPGGIDTWHDIIRKKSTKAMNRMVEYCKQDVVVLERIYDRMISYVPHKTHINGIKEDCPNCGGPNTVSNGYRLTATGTRKNKRQCTDCGTYFQVTESKKKTKYGTQ